MTIQRTVLAFIIGLASTAAVLATPTATSATSATVVRHDPVRAFVPRGWHAVPARPAPAPPSGQRITGHPDVLAAVNAARARKGWPAVRYGNNLAAETCALNTTHCNGVQWGGCPLTPLPGNQYTATIGTAQSNGPRGCIQTISFSSFS